MMRGIQRYIVLFSFLAGAAWADIALLGEKSYDYTAQAGQRFEGSLSVSNRGSDVAEVKFYQTDYSFNAEGSYFFDPPGTNPRSNASWIRLSAPTVIIPPGEKAATGFSLEVPDDPELSGSYWSVIMVEEVKPPPPESSSGGLALTHTVRYAVQILVTLGKTGSPRITFHNAKASVAEKELVFTVDAKNVGDRFAKPVLTLELVSASGKSVGKFTLPGYRLYPGSTFRYRFELPVDLPREDYKGIVIADCGDNILFGANVGISLKP